MHRQVMDTKIHNFSLRGAALPQVTLPVVLRTLHKSVSSKADLFRSIGHDSVELLVIICIPLDLSDYVSQGFA